MAWHRLLDREWSNRVLYQLGLKPTRLLVQLLVLPLFLNDHNSASAQEGYRWEVIARKTPLYPLAAVSFLDTLHGWMSGGGDSLYYTTDGGSSWPSAGEPFFLARSYALLDTLQGWAVGTQGPYTAIIAHTRDGGRSWQKQFEADPCQLWDGWTFSPEHLLAVGTLRSTISSTYDTAVMVWSTDKGGSWHTDRGVLGTSYNHVCFSDSLHGWISTRGFLNADTSLMLRTSDGGKTWEQITLPHAFSRLGPFQFLDSLRGWAGDSFGGLFRTTDGGSRWERSERILPGDEDNFAVAAISFTDSLYGWAFGDCFYQGIITEAIYHTTDGGLTWTRESVGLTGDLGSLNDGLMLDRTHGWAVSGDGAVLAYRPTTSGIGQNDGSARVPQKILLEHNYPNPFNGQTTISFALPEAQYVRLTVTDLLGQEIMQLLPLTLEAAGRHSISFDSTGLASGIYFYHLHTHGGGMLTRAMLLLK